MLPVLAALQPFMVAETYAKGASITLDLVRSNNVFLVESGSVLVEHVSLPSETERRIGTLKTRGSFIGLKYVFSQNERRSAAIVSAVEKSTIYKIPCPELKQVITDNQSKGQILAGLLAYLAEEVDDLTYRMEELAVHSYYPGALVLSVLTRLAETRGIAHKGGGICIPVNTSLIAKLCGLSPESTRRACNQLIKEEKIARLNTNSYLIFS
jgi:CRP-like cAMP-binding protein